MELPKETILLTGTKILSGLKNDADAAKLLESLSTSDINLEDPIQSGFISESLIQFDRILTTTTIELWQTHKE